MKTCTIYRTQPSFALSLSFSSSTQRNKTPIKQSHKYLRLVPTSRRFLFCSSSLFDSFEFGSSSCRDSHSSLTHEPTRVIRVWVAEPINVDRIDRSSAPYMWLFAFSCTSLLFQSTTISTSNISINMTSININDKATGLRTNVEHVDLTFGVELECIGFTPFSSPKSATQLCSEILQQKGLDTLQA